jgi:hypothetical protein
MDPALRQVKKLAQNHTVRVQLKYNSKDVFVILRI